MRTAEKGKLFTDMDGTVCFQQEIHGIAPLGQTDHQGRINVKQPGTNCPVTAIDWSTTLAGRNYGIYVDIQTAQRMQILHDAGIEIVPVTGARGKTMAPRLRSMPFVSRAIIENGGRIVDRDMNDDPAWLDHLAAQISVLEQMKRRLSSVGIVMDNKDRKAMIRIRLIDNPMFNWISFNQFYENLNLPDGLKKTRNLGHIDIIPVRAGKGNAIDYILQKEGGAIRRVFGIGDDLNDSPLLEKATDAYVLGSGHEDVVEQARALGYYVSKGRYFAGINEILNDIGLKLGVAMPGR